MTFCQWHCHFVSPCWWCWFARARVCMYIGDIGGIWPEIVKRSKVLSKGVKLQICLNVICVHISLIFSVLGLLEIAKYLKISVKCRG